VSDYGYPKFAWMARVAEDDRLSDAAARVLTDIANQNVRGNADWFCVRQETVAANLHKHVNTVANALRRGRELGWLELAVERPRGRGWHQANTYRLTTPGKPTPASGYYKEIPTPGVRNTHTPSEKYAHGEVEIPTRRNSPTSENDPPTGCISTGFRGTGFNTQGVDNYVDNDESAALSRLFDGVFGKDGYRAVDAEQAALPALPIRAQSTRPLADEERCPKHERLDPDCVTCRAFARARGERL
jgi:hypothetical protein